MSVSIQTQKILSFIPVVNISVFFIWFYNYRKIIKDRKLFRKSFLYVLPLTFVFGLCIGFIPEIGFSESITFICQSVVEYLYLFTLARVVIFLQKPYLDRDQGT